MDADIQIVQASPEQIPLIHSVLAEASGWIAARGQPLWSPDEISEERIAASFAEGLTYLAFVDGAPAQAPGVLSGTGLSLPQRDARGPPLPRPRRDGADVIAIRPVRLDDAAHWLRLRHGLWPDEEGLAEDIERFFAGTITLLDEVLVAVDEN